MKLLPNTITMRCPVCRASIRLPLTYRSTNDGASGFFRADPAPMIEHIKTLHPGIRVEFAPQHTEESGT